MNIPESEHIERCALEDLHEAADESDRSEVGLGSATLNSAFVSVASRLPPSAIVVNRCLGLGLGRHATRDEVASLVAEYNRNGIARYFVHLHPEHQPEGLKQWLADSGLKAGRGWQKFSRGREPVAPCRSELTTEVIGADRGKEFAEILCNAFDIGQSAVNWFARIPQRPDWHVFMSFKDGKPAGVGALYVRDGFGWTDFGATAPEHRRQGSQGLLMQARLTRAMDLGCERVFTCTGVSTPGDPQHSYSNILKAGFREEYVRDNYEPA